MPLFETANLTVEVVEQGLARLWLDVQNRTYNVFNRQVLADLDAALDRVAAEPAVRSLVVLSRKPNGFIAGADLYEFARINGPAEAIALSEAGQKLMDKVAGLRVPTLAVLHGPVLGGGLEFALACDYRLVLDQPGTQIGLPEIELGLIPAWGGTQRLPRVVGLERALHIILQRKRLSAQEAVRWQLADAIQPGQAEALTFIQQEFVHRLAQGKRPKEGPPRRGWRQRLVESNLVGRWLLFRGAEQILRRKVPDDMPAPLEALRAVRTGVAQGMVAGLRAEREAVGRLSTTLALRNMLTLYFLVEQAKKVKDAEAAAPPIRRVGIVGAGTMGAGIAQLAAVKGFEVVVQEVNAAALAAGVKKIEDLFRKAVERRLLSPAEAEQKLAAVGRTTSWEGFADVDLAIEAVIEDLNLKWSVFQALEQRTRPDTILATNTSSIPVRQLQEGLAHPNRVGGLHFFNPVHKMMLIEVVRAPATDAAVPTRLAQFAAGLGKTPVVVGDSPGFVVNRVLMPYLGEAVVLAAQEFPVDQVDGVMRRFGMPMGPLELIDQVGLDVAAHITRSMQPAMQSRLGSPQLAGQILRTFEQMAEKGWLGQKSGTGFYRYAGKKKRVNADALTLLPDDVGDATHLHSNHPLEDERREARERMVLLMVNEAAACLGEGLAERADAIDLALVLGTGWAPHRGGPLRYADDRGVADIVRVLEDLAKKHGPRFEPCAELRRRAATKEPLYGPREVPEPT